MAGINYQAFAYYKRLKKIQEYVEQHYAQKISLDDMARLVNLERTYFSAFFKRRVGVPFSFWLGHYRVAKATEIMRAGNRAIQSVARDVGFQDIRTFERVFKKHTQMTPREFKYDRCLPPLREGPK